VPDWRRKSSSSMDQVCRQYHGTFQEDLWLKTRLALVRIASHFSDAGRDDQRAPSLWSTWLRGVLAELLNARGKG
jgi:hypothetical protein